MSESIYTLNANKADGSLLKLSEYANNVSLVVNTASQCGFTPQYEALEALYQQFNAAGFMVLAFPCNQFGNQEPGNNEQIQSFCTTRYNVSFPVFAKIDVNGENTHPVFTAIKRQAPGVLGSERIKWNFTKFLVAKNGHAIKRYAPATSPENISRDIEDALGRDLC